jgi:hypothetical protein
MTTVWPIDEDIYPPDAREQQCGDLIDHYDLEAGLEALRDAKAQHGHVDGDGPYLIGWSPSISRGKPDQVVLVLDMSGYKSQDRFNRAFQFWRDKIIENPKLWRLGFSAEQLRLGVRDFVNRYGAALLPVVSISRSARQAAKPR